MYRQSDRTNDDGREKGRVRRHKTGAHGAGNEWDMLIKVTPWGRV